VVDDGAMGFTLRAPRGGRVARLFDPDGITRFIARLARR
jgi:hypothetical protein